MASIPKVDRYRYVSDLGRGGMSQVVLAEDVLLGREVALKHMHSSDDSGALLRLRREALIGASVSHPNLVSIYDIVANAGGEYVIVMEYVEGRTLRDALARGRMPVAEVLRILDSVAAALDAIHAQGIVHRDVKPANILLAANGQVKLADLGIASAPDRTRITAEGVILGTLGYVAPEQIEGHPVTSATDVYALAVVAYEMLSGRKARSEPNAVALAHAIVTRPPPDLGDAWPEAPAAAVELLKRALDADPAQRPRSATELTRGLRDAIQTPATTQRLQPRPAPAEAVARPQRAKGVGVAAVAGAGASAGTPAPAAAAGGTVPATAVGERRRPRGALVVSLLGLLAVAAIVAALIDQSTSGSAATAARRTQSHRSPSSRRHRRSAASAATSASTGSGSSSSNGSAAAVGPSAVSVPASTGVAAGDAPIATAERFYTLAAAHRYPEAWALADPTFRNQLGGYASFENGQALDRSITFDSARVVSQTATTATLAVRTTSVRANGTQHCTGTIRLQRAGSPWLLHLIGISCT